MAYMKKWRKVSHDSARVEERCTINKRRLEAVERGVRKGMIREEVLQQCWARIPTIQSQADRGLLCVKPKKFLCVISVTNGLWMYQNCIPKTCLVVVCAFQPCRSMFAVLFLCALLAFYHRHFYCLPSVPRFRFVHPVCLSSED